MGLLEETRDRFKHDVYATATSGINIDSVQVGRAVCSMPIKPNHLNAAGFVMGGAIYTLADFAFAVAANTEREITVTLSASIDFIAAASDKMLTAVAQCVKDGKVTFYDVEVRDSTSKLIARIHCSGYRKSSK